MLKAVLPAKRYPKRGEDVTFFFISYQKSKPGQ